MATQDSIMSSLKDKDCDLAKDINNSLIAVPMTGLLVVNDHISVSVLDSVGGKFYVAYEILDLKIPFYSIHTTRDLHIHITLIIQTATRSAL